MNRSGILTRLIEAGLLLIIIVAPTQYSFEVAKRAHLSLVDPVIWIVCLLWLVSVLRSRSWAGIRLTPLPTALFVLLAATSILKSAGVFSSLKDLFQLTEYFIAAYVLFLSNTRDNASFQRAAVTLLLTSVVVVLFGMIHYLTPAVSSFEVRSFFANRNSFGGYLAIAVPIMYGVAIYDQNLPRRIALGLAIIACALITLSAASLIAMTAALVIMSVFRSKWLFLCILLLIALLAAILTTDCMPRPNAEILQESIAMFDDDGAVTKRYAEWQAATAMAQENWLFGVGLGDYQDNVGSYYGTVPCPPGAAEADSQNLYLVLASSIGLLGLLSFIAVLAFHAKLAFMHHIQTSDRFQKGIALGILGSIIAYSINSIWSPLLVRGIGLPLAIVLALAAALPRLETETADTAAG